MSTNSFQFIKTKKPKLLFWCFSFVLQVTLSTITMVLNSALTIMTTTSMRIVTAQLCSKVDGGIESVWPVTSMVITSWEEAILELLLPEFIG